MRSIYGQNVKVSGQRDEEEERGYGGYTFGYGFGYGARRKGAKIWQRQL